MNLFSDNRRATKDAAGKAKLPRGLRNNNPGSLKYFGDPWVGLDFPPQDKDGFCRYAEMKFGIRALARTLETITDKRQAPDGSPIDTVSELVHYYAPACENNTEAYVAFILKRVGLVPGQKFDLHQYTQMRAFSCAIMFYECGGNLPPDSVIDAGLALAGFVPEKPENLKRSRTMKGGTVGVLGGAGVLATQYAETLQSAGPLISRVVQYAPWALGVVIVGVAGWILYARWDDHRKGLR